MNHIHQIIWNKNLGAWIVASELARRGKKRGSIRRNTFILPLLFYASAGFALPNGNELVAGSVNVVTPSPGQMQINQSSQKAIVNWQGFSIAEHESVDIQQPNANAALLNRVVGQDASSIQGKLNANGQVYLVNPNGVLFSKTAQVDVGGLIAGTHAISNQDFLNGKLHFTQDNAKGSVINQGHIKTPEGGVVALIGEQVENTGGISTPKGTTALAAGKTVDLDMHGDGLVEVKITEAAINAQINNHGIIQADGGQVIMTAKAAGQLLNTVINNDGIVEARGLVEKNGKIVLSGGDNGVVQVSGTLDASGQAGNNVAQTESSNTHGGNITVSGKQININNGAILNASGDAGGGTIVIGDKQVTSQTTLHSGSSIAAQARDHGKAGKIEVLANMNNGTVKVEGQLTASAPKHGDGGFIETSAAHVKVADSAKITTQATKGKTGTWLIDPVDFTIAASGGDITGAALSTNLSSANVAIASTAGSTGVNGDVNVNDAVTWSTNQLTLNAQRNININANLNGSGTAQLALQYGQASLGGGVNDNYFINNGAKVTLPAGPNFSTQKGSEGSVSNYTVITSLGAEGSTTAADLQGMNGDTTKNYALGADIDAGITSTWNSGAGFLPIGDVIRDFTGNFAGLRHTISDLTINRPATETVGLFGTISNITSISNVGLLNANIIGFNYVGTLVGESRNLGTSIIINSYATGSVNATGGNSNNILTSAGGLIGRSFTNISNSHANVSVTSNGFWTGGLVGEQQRNISNSYAAGNVNGLFAGGLVGYLCECSGSLSVSDSYATGSVSGSTSSGGLIGATYLGTVTNSYATGNVSGTTGALLGGLIGSTISGTSPAINNSFWDTDSTSQDTSAGGGTGLTTSQLMTQSTYTNQDWDFTNTWWMSDGNTRPFLRMEYSTNITNAHQLQLMAIDLSANYTLANNLDLTPSLAAVNGHYPGMWSSQGFVPVGDAVNGFTGNFDGLGQTITGLTINRPSTDFVGLFGSTSTGSTISNLGLEGISIAGFQETGGLVGSNDGSINNAYVTGSVTGINRVGGLVGSNNGTISTAYATGKVTGTSDVGGLVGISFDTINNAYATGSVTGTSDVGGLVGFSFDAISNAYATGSVTGSDAVGGLVGAALDSNISNAYATGIVTGVNTVGGLVGELCGDGCSSSISNAYATGSVTGTSGVGGLVGNAGTGSPISNAYATGRVSGTSFFGGLVGNNNLSSSNISNAFWDTATSLQAIGIGGVGAPQNGVTGLATAQMMQLASFSSWNTVTPNTIASTGGSVAVWRIYEGFTAPLLRSFLTPLTVTADNISKTYNGVSDSTLTNASYSIAGADTSGHLFNIANPYNGAINVGTTNYTPTGLYSDQQGYDISLVNAVLTINPATLTYTANTAARLYGTANPPFSGAVTGFVNVDTLASATTGAASFDSTALSASNVGNYAITGSGLAANNGNYLFAQAASNATALSITPAELTAAITGNPTKTYDSTTAATLAAANFNLTGFIDAQGAGVTQTAGTYNSADVVTADTVTATLTAADFTANAGTLLSNYSLPVSASGAGEITPAALIVAITGNPTKTYDSTTAAALEAANYSLTGFIGTQGAGVTQTAGTYNSADVVSSDTVTAALTAADFTANTGTLLSNYSLPVSASGAGQIIPAALTAAITGNPTKPYDGTTAAALAVTNYTLTGFTGTQGAGVTQTAGTYNSADVVTANTVTAALTAADFTANAGTLLSNYSLPVSASGNGAITPALMTITANDDRKIFNGLAYAGGNGVTYTGLVNNETGSVLAGSLTYGGNSQGAINAGAYDITPGGLSSGNYSIAYLNGQLTIFNSQAIPDNFITGVRNNIVPSVTSVTYEAPLIPASYNPSNIPVRPDLSVNDSTEYFAGNTYQYCDDSTPDKQKINCQKRLKNEHPILPVLKIKNSAGRVMRLQMSANKQFLSLLLEDGSVRIWDFQRGDQHQIVTQNKNQPLTDISPVDDKGELVSIAGKAGIGTQDVIIPALENPAINEPDIKQFMTSNDGSLLLVSAGADQLSLWDSKHNKQLWQLPYERGVVSGLALTDNKHYGAVLSRQPGSYVLPTDLQLKSLTDAVDIVDLGTGKVIKTLPNMGEQIISIQFKDNDTLQLRLASGELLDWPMTSPGGPKRVADFAETVTAVDPATNNYAYALEDGTVRVGDGQGHVLLSIKNENNPFQSAKLLEGGKKLLTVMANGELSLWDVASGKKLLRLFSTQQGWTVMDAFGRFDGSEEAMENFSWSANEEDIPLDSFSENYYEPGLLSNVLQNQDYLNSNPNMVQDGITLPPKVALQIAGQQDKSDKVALQLDVYDRGGGIDKIHVYQNGKRLSDESIVAAQQTIQENGAEHRVLTLNITPRAGKNTLKVTAGNDMGIENSGTELNFDGKTKAYASSLRLMTVGIDKYSDPRLNLEYSVTDAESIGQAINTGSKIASIKNLTNENATKPRILAELKELSQGTQQDVLIIYFAGHGLALGKEWYFLPYETTLQPTLEKIAATGITATELSDIFKDSKIQHILLMVDSCYSGAGMDAFSKLENGQRYFTRRLSRSLGITVMTAAAKDQKAFELESLGHGLFTYLITQKLQEKDATQSLTAHGVAENIAKTLPVFSKKMLGSSQEPAVYTKGNDFMLTDVPKEASKGNASDSDTPVTAPKKRAQ